MAAMVRSISALSMFLIAFCGCSRNAQDVLSEAKQGCRYLSLALDSSKTPDPQRATDEELLTRAGVLLKKAASSDDSYKSLANKFENFDAQFRTVVAVNAAGSEPSADQLEAAGEAQDAVILECRRIINIPQP